MTIINNSKCKYSEQTKFNTHYVLIHTVIIALATFMCYAVSDLIFKQIFINDFVKCKPQHFNLSSFNFETPKISPKLKYWKLSVVEWNKNGNLRSMDRVFEKLGYEFVNASNGDDWDILWSKEHPYYHYNIFPFNETKYKPHQKINHFPGNNYLVGKSKMSILNNGSKYILRAFRNENMKELKNFIAANPDKQFVKKNIHNRGVKIVNAEEINENVNKTFYQVFLDKPFLVDGHSFDFGVFVLITSIEPLRIYRYDEEVLLRFCPEKYYPFNKTDTKKYVVADNHLPTYKMKVFNETYKNYKLSFKVQFEDYIRDQGHSVKRLWKQIDDAIVTIILKSSENIKNKLYDLSQSSTNFFELVRFDFVFDENLNAYVMEVNLSPNMTPVSSKFEENSIFYEQIIYNVVKMIGGGSYMEFMGRFNNDITIVHDKNIAVNPQICVKNDCINNCKDFKCRLCLPCLNDSLFYEIQEAYREHLHEENFIRVFPKKMHFTDKKFRSKLCYKDNMLIDWYRAKCKRDKRWY